MPTSVEEEENFNYWIKEVEFYYPIFIFWPLRRLSKVRITIKDVVYLPDSSREEPNVDRYAPTH